LRRRGPAAAPNGPDGEAERSVLRCRTARIALQYEPSGTLFCGVFTTLIHLFYRLSWFFALLYCPFLMPMRCGTAGWRLPPETGVFAVCRPLGCRFAILREVFVIFFCRSSRSRCLLMPQPWPLFATAVKKTLHLF
jgi:hypothetical protein